jgi:cardiolipin synthase
MFRKKRSSAVTRLNRVKLIPGGKEYFDLLIHLIDKSEESIHLQTYIFDDDETGIMVAEA